ncbi:MAG: energy transducer TonB [Gammaproteobacteria bacterium]
MSPPASAPREAPAPAAAPASAAPIADAAQSSASASTRSPGAPSLPSRTAPRADATWAGNTPPPYPKLARRLGEEGDVLLDIRVERDGRVSEVRLERSSGFDRLDQAAMDTVRTWRFQPATVDGQPVAEWYRNWKWVFRLKS